MIERKIFAGRLNDDDSRSVVPVEDYVNAKNIRIMPGDNGGMAEIKNLPSTQWVTFELTGTNEVIGGYEDEEYDRIFFFLYSTTQNRILCYRKATDDLKVVLKDDNFATGYSLNFSQSSLATGVGKAGDFLYWTDNNNEPRRVNVERAMKTNDPSYTHPDGTTLTAYETPLKEEDITVIRRGPIYPPNIEKLVSTDEPDVDDQAANFIDKNAFQFAYRYYYKDGTTSVLSPYSVLANYNNPDVPDAFDTVRISIPQGEEIRSEVQKVELCYRFPNSNDWRIIKTWNRSVDDTVMDNHNVVGQAPLSYDFFNSQVGIAISEGDATKLFDRVPIRSKALEVARNRLFLGNNTIGYDPITSLAMTASVVTQGAGSGIAGQYVYVFVECDDGSTTEHILVYIPSGASSGYYYFSGAYSAYNFFSAKDLPTSIALSIGDKIGSIALSDAAILNLVAPCEGLYNASTSYVEHTYTGTQPTVIGLGTTAPVNEGSQLWKTASKYQVGIVFYDGYNRSNSVYTNDNCLVTTADRVYSQATFNTGINWNLPTGTVSAIPLWARYYQIVITKNLTTRFFVQHKCDEVTYARKQTDSEEYTFNDTYNLTLTAGIAWDITQLLDSGLGYTFQEGDLLKIYPDDDSDPITFRIIDQQGKYVITTPQNLGTLGAGGIYDDVVFEIYTPYQQTENEPFYEYGKVYPITGAGSASRSFTVTSGTLMGDVIYKTRTLSTGGQFRSEAMNPDDRFYTDWVTDHGRVNLVITDSGQENKPTSLIWSSTYIVGSKINGLSSFSAIDETILDERMGPIQKLVLTNKMQSEGTVLLSICQNETASMYLGETQLTDSADQTLLASSGAVIGTIRELRGSYGTSHPESVVENKGRVYWYSEGEGAVVRYNANGLTPISEYKLRSFFKRMGNLTGGLKIVGGYDEFQEEYLLTIPDTGSTTDVEYLEDFVDEVIQTGNLTSTSSPVSIGATLTANTSYTFSLSFGAYPGDLVVYVAGSAVYSDTITGPVDITIVSTRGGAISYTYTLKTSGSTTGTYTLYGPRTSCHQLWDGTAKTLGFRDVDGAEGWIGSYSFVPDWISRVGNLLVTFKNGYCYTHDGMTYNTFYGTQYRSMISFVLNNPPNVPKLPASIAIEGNTVPYWVHFRAENPTQSTDLESADFRTREGIYYAEVLRDRLSPNASGTAVQKLYAPKADKLRSRVIEVCVEWANFTSELRVSFVDLKYQVSQGHFTTEQ